MAIWIRILYQLVTYWSVHTAIFNMTDIKYMSLSNFQKSFQMMCSGGWAYQCKKQIQSISVSCSQLYQKPYCKTPTILIKCFCSFRKKRTVSLKNTLHSCKKENINILLFFRLVWIQLYSNYPLLKWNSLISNWKNWCLWYFFIKS